MERRAAWPEQPLRGCSQGVNVWMCVTPGDNLRHTAVMETCHLPRLTAPQKNPTST